MSELARVTTKVREAAQWRGLITSAAAWCTASVIGRVGGEHISQVATRRFSESAMRRLGIDLVAEGVHKVAPAAPCVIVANHLSQLDIPVLGALLSDVEYRWVFKRELFRVPFVGWHLWAAGHIAVDRARGGNLTRMNAQIDEVFARGMSVMFFPEGTRSADGALARFRAGAFIAAVRAGVPVLPIVMDGTERLLKKGSMALPSGRNTVRVAVLDPVAPPPGNEPEARVAALSADVRQRMCAALDALRGSPGAAERPTI
ncbi:MAG: lysophospholipid acyltransferase family protein [Myxococcota bacterium]